MAARLSTAARNAGLDAIVDLLDAGAGAAKLKIYTGTQPGSVGGSEAGNTLLGTLTCSDPAFGASSGGTATASAITSDTSADDNGTAGHFLLTDSNDTVVIDGDIGQGSGTLSLNNTTIVIGGTIAVTSGSFTLPIS